MEGKTKLITVTNSADTPVKALTWTAAITVGEDASVVGYPTVDFLVKKPTAADDARRVQSGGTYTFQKGLGGNESSRYGPGDIAGYVRTVAGTSSFIQDEK